MSQKKFLIHFIWFTGPYARNDDMLPNEVAVQLNCWAETHPHLTIKCWSWSDCTQLLSDPEGQRIMNCVKACRFPAMQADILRLAILYRQGGIWSDIKNQPRCSFINPSLCSNDLVLAEHFPLEQRPDPMGKLCNSFFICTRGHNFIRLVLNNAITNVEERRLGGVFGLTGGSLFDYWAGKTSIKNADGTVILDHITLWSRFIKRVAMSYNKGEMHWSRRQKNESVYVDE